MKRLEDMAATALMWALFVVVGAVAVALIGGAVQVWAVIL